MKRSIKTEALVLRKRSLPNQDKIITLFTQVTGKINVFAKGIKKITSRRLPHVQTGNLIQVMLYKKIDRYYLQETALISGFSELKKNPLKIQFLYLYIFVSDRLLPENQTEDEVYNLFKKHIIKLSNSSKPNDSLAIDYLNELLVILGYSKDDKTFDQLKATIQDIIHEKIPDLHL